MATPRFVLAMGVGSMVALTLGIQGCSTRAAHTRHQPPTFAQAAPTVTTESWATVLPWPGIEQDRLAYARRDTALGLPPPGYTGVAGTWRDSEKPSLTRYQFIPLSRSQHTYLFFTPNAQYERRAPRVPRRAHPWRTAW